MHASLLSFDDFVISNGKSCPASLQTCTDVEVFKSCCNCESPIARGGLIHLMDIERNFAIDAAVNLGPEIASDMVD